MIMIWADVNDDANALVGQNTYPMSVWPVLMYRLMYILNYIDRTNIGVSLF